MIKKKVQINVVTKFISRHKQPVKSTFISELTYCVGKRCSWRWLWRLCRFQMTVVKMFAYLQWESGKFTTTAGLYKVDKKLFWLFCKGGMLRVSLLRVSLLSVSLLSVSLLSVFLFSVTLLSLTLLSVSVLSVSVSQCSVSPCSVSYCQSVLLHPSGKSHPPGENIWLHKGSTALRSTPWETINKELTRLGPGTSSARSGLQC